MTTPTDPEAERLTAYHEASHGAAALKLGFKVTEVSIRLAASPDDAIFMFTRGGR